MAALPWRVVPLQKLAEHDSFFKQSDPDQVPPPSLPVADGTRSFWASYNPLAKEGSTGDLATEADIVVIGSGITGTSAVYHLVQKLSSQALPTSTKVMMLEARDFCSGATGRNGGHMTAISFFDFCKKRNILGESEAKKCSELERQTVSEILSLIHEHDLQDSVDLIEGRRTILMLTEEEHRAALSDMKAAESSGLDVSDVRVFTAEETEKMYSVCLPAIQTTGNNIWPLKFVTRLYEISQKSAKEASVALSLHTHTPVRSIARQDNCWLIDTSRGSIKTKFILHATNGYAAYLLPHLRGPNGIIPCRGQVIATSAPSAAKHLAASGWTANDHFEYWFAYHNASGKDDRAFTFILGGAREVDPHFELYQNDDSVINPVVSKSLRAFLPSLFPTVFPADRQSDIEWTGIMGFTKTGDPFVGPVDNGSAVLDGQYISAGYTGHGMPRAYSCANVAVDMLLYRIRHGTQEGWKQPDWFPRSYLPEAF